MKTLQDTKSFSSGRRNRRKGLSTLEMILVLPVLLLVTFAGIEFGVLLLVRQAVSHAATVAAREAAKGADMDDLEIVIEKVLGPHDIKIGCCASFILEDPSATDTVQQSGTFACTHPPVSCLDPDEVRVTVCIDMGKRPCLNALKSFGLNLSGRRMAASSFAKKEST